MKYNREGKYWFQEDLPKEVYESCINLLRENQDLIPSWCEEVRVCWDSQGEHTINGNSAAAYIESNYAYRYARLSICPPFLNDSEEDRLDTIRHELAHIVTAPLVNYVRDSFSILADEDEPLCQLISKELGEKVESVTEDLKNIIVLLKNKK